MIILRQILAAGKKRAYVRRETGEGWIPQWIEATVKHGGEKTD